MPFDEDHDGLDLAMQFQRLHGRGPLPEIWIEDTGDLPVDKDDTDVWDIPNLYYFARSDARFGRAPGNTTQISNPTQTGTQWGDSLAVIHEACEDQWAAHWASIGKTFKVCPLVVGFDTDGPLKLITHANDLLGGGGASFFRSNGIAQVGAFVAAAAARYAATADTSVVVATLDDIEEFGTVWGDPALMAANLADARSATESVNMAGDTMVEWLATRTTDLNGDPLPAWNSGQNRFHPLNWEAQRPGTELDMCVTAYAIRQAVAQPFADHLGVAGLRHGSWNMVNASRDHPGVYRQTQYAYALEGDFALGYSCPINYRTIPAVPWRSEGSVDSDSRWETVDRTSAAYGVVPADQDEAAAAVNIELCRSIGAIPGHKLFPSIDVRLFPGTLGDAVYIAARDHMIRWMVDAAQNGAERFWMFTPGYNTTPATRAKVADFVAAFNAAWG